VALKDLDLGGGYVLSHDSRDIPLPCELRKTVREWCEKQNIRLEGHKYNVAGVDIWRVKDDEQRVRFLLRWA